MIENNETKNTEQVSQKGDIDDLIFDSFYTKTHSEK